MSDSSEILSLLSDEQYESSINEYTDSQWEFITDYNNGSYSSSSVFFDTQPALNKWVVWKDAYLQVPIQVSSSGTAYADATILLAMKTSVLSFLSSIQIATSSGQTIVSDNNVSLINNLRLLVEKEFEWQVEESGKLMFAKDQLTTPSSTAVGGTVPANTSTTNIGFLSRIQLFKQQSAFAGNTFSCVLNIPLRYVHDFFDKMSFPQINSRYQLTFGFSTGSAPVMNAFTSDSVGPVVAPTCSIATASTNGVSLSNCRLYYKSVKFSPSLNQQLVQKLNSGYSKKVFYRVTDTYLPAASEIGQTTGTVQKLISASTVHPLRVWLVSPATTGISASAGLLSSQAAWTNANIMINNVPYYQNSMNTISEQWTILEDQFPGSGNSNAKGGLLNYSDFINTYRLLCFDVSRLKDRLSDPNSAVSIQVQATRANATSCDYYYVVERLQAVTFQFNASETKIILGL